MRIGIVGAGSTGLGTAALVTSRGHTSVIWSPRGSRIDVSSDHLEVRTCGALDTQVDGATVSSPAGLTSVEVIFFCDGSSGQKEVMDTTAPHLREEQTIVIVSHFSLSALYLSKLLAERGIFPVILALSTPPRGGPIVDGEVPVSLFRQEIGVAALPASAAPRGVQLLRSILGDHFVPSDDLIAITLNNPNLSINMAIALLNLTRIETDEPSDSSGIDIECVGRLIESIDEERLAVATGYGVRVRTAGEHYIKSFPGLSEGTLYEKAKIVGAGIAGVTARPKSVRSRWLVEDLPFGTAAIIAIAEVARIELPLHVAGLALLSAATGRDYRRDNDLLSALGVKFMTAAELKGRAREGWLLEPELNTA